MRNLVHARLRWLTRDKSQCRFLTDKKGSSTINDKVVGSQHATPQQISSPSGGSQKRIDRLLSRTPKFLRRHVVALRSAPVSHVTSFLLLHELTAVLPLFGLAGAFHYYNWLPPYFAEGAWVVGGVEKFGRYFKRKGWISSQDEAEVEVEARKGEDLRAIEKRADTGSGKWWNRGEGGVRWVVEFATAYAVVKALLVPRLIFSAWAAPAFARWTIIPIVNGFKRSKLAQGIINRVRTSKAG